MASPTKILTNARPVRVAYFVQDDESSEFVLDAIFAASFGFWGGRFSLIVPCDEGKPRPAFIPWLTAFDPDVIYSYVDLEESVIEQMHERLYPSFLIRHQTHSDPPHDARAYRPRLPIDPLHIDTMVPLAAAPYRFTPGQVARVLNVSGRLSNNRFIGDNFGAWMHSSGHSFPSYLNEYGHTLTLIDDQDSQPRGQYFKSPEETIGSVNDLLELMERTRVTTVAGLSTMETPRLEVSNWPWSNSFNLVVGDSFTDRLVYWNARSVYPKWRDRDIVDLRLPSKYLDDKDFLKLLAKLLRARNRVTMESGSNVPRTTIRSSSVPTKELDDLAEILKGDSGWISYETKAVSAPEDCLPEQDALERSVFRVSDMLLARESSNWKESFALDEEIRPDPPHPEHLRFGPPGILSPYNGVWATEFEIERKINHSPYSNVNHVWRLPRRLRMASSFLGG